MIYNFKVFSLTFQVIVDKGPMEPNKSALKLLGKMFLGEESRKERMGVKILYEA